MWNFFCQPFDSSQLQPKTTWKWRNEEHRWNSLLCHLFGSYQLQPQTKLLILLLFLRARWTWKGEACQPSPVLLALLLWNIAILDDTAQCIIIDYKSWDQGPRVCRALDLDADDILYSVFTRALIRLMLLQMSDLPCVDYARWVEQNRALRPRWYCRAQDIIISYESWDQRPRGCRLLVFYVENSAQHIIIDYKLWDQGPRGCRLLDLYADDTAQYIIIDYKSWDQGPRGCRLLHFGLSSCGQVSI